MFAQDNSAELNIVHGFSEKSSSPIKIMLDSGSSHTIIRLDIFKAHFGNIGIPCHRKMHVAGCILENNIVQKAKITLKLKTINNQIVELTIFVLVAKTLNNQELIMGNNVLRDFSITTSITPYFWVIKDNNTEKIIPFLKTEEHTIILFESLNCKIPPGTHNIILHPTNHQDLIKPHQFNGIDLIYDKIPNQPRLIINSNHLVLNYHNKSKEFSIHCSITNISKSIISINKGEILLLTKQYLPPLSIVNDISSYNISYENGNSHEIPDDINLVYSELEKNKPNLIMNEEFSETLPRDELKPKGKDLSYLDCQIELSDLNLKNKLIKVLKNYSDIFSKHNLDVGCSSAIMAHIEADPKLLKPEKPRPLPADKLHELKIIVKEMEKAGIIMKANGHHLSMMHNILLVPKNNRLQGTKADKYINKHLGIKTSKFRFCSDLRGVNKAIVNNTALAMPSPDEIVSKLSGKIVSSVDVTSAFFSIRLTEQSRSLMGFFVDKNLYTYCRMPQGLSVSPGIYLALMEITFSNEIMQAIKKNNRHLVSLPDSFESFLSYFVDDIYIGSDTEEDHMLHLEATFLALQMGALKISPDKCHFFASSIKILGVHLDVKRSELSLELAKAQAILEWPRPDSLYTLQSRLYALVYFQKFIPYLSEISFPLTSMLRNKTFQWGEKEERAWIKIKSMIAADLSLTIPEPSEPLIITVDASRIGVSSILWVEKNKQLKPVMTYSKLLSLADCSKPIYFKEMIALCLAFKTFQPYLFRTKVPVSCFTDCKGLIFIGRHRFTNTRCQTLSDYIALQANLYEINLFHMPGKINILADLLSRNIVQSRFLTGKAVLSKQAAANLPPLPENFLVSSEQIYKFLTSNIHENCDSGKTIFTPVPQKLEDVYSIFKNVSAEERYLSAIRLIEQNNDPSLISLNKTFTENKKDTLIHANELVDTAFKEIDLPRTLKTQIRNSLHENFLKHKKSSIIKPQLNNISTKKVSFRHENSNINKKKVTFNLDSSCYLPLFSNTDNLHFDKNHLKVKHKNNSKFEIYYQIDHNIPNPIHPRVAYSQSFGIDLPIQKDFLIPPLSQLLIDTHIKLSFPPNCYGQIYARSSTAKRDIFIHNGQIDRDYNDTIKLLIKNFNDNTIEIKKGEFLAQVFIHIVIPPKLKEIDELTILGERNNQGFGSSDNTRNLVNTECNLTQLHHNDYVNTHTYKILNVNIINIEDVNTKCNNCNFNYPITYFDSINDKICCTSSRESYEDLSCSLKPESFLNNMIVFLNNNDLSTTSAKAKQVEHDFLKNVIEKMVGMQTIYQQDKISAIKTGQSSDEFCMIIKDDLDKNPNNTRFIMKKGLIFKKIENRLLLIVPDSLISMLLYDLHVTLGHISKTGLLRIFQTLYYHPKARTYIKSITDSCQICPAIKPIQEKDITLGTNRTLQETQQNRSFYFDVIPMINDNNYKHLVLFSDAFSSYVIGYPIKQKTGESVARIIELLINSFGLVSNFYCDNDASLAKTAEIISKKYPINFFTCCPHSQHQNQAENNYKLVKEKLLLLIHGSNMTWTNALPLALMQVNNSILSKTNLSRYNVHFGSMSNIEILAHANENDINPNDISKWKKSKLLRKLEYEKKGKVAPEIKIGSIVYVKQDNPSINESSILRKPNKNPAKVIETDKRSVKVQCLVTGSIFHTHVRKLRLLNLAEYIPLIANFPQTGTVNFKRSKQPKPPFSSILDPDGLNDLKKLFDEELTDYKHDESK